MPRALPHSASRRPLMASVGPLGGVVVEVGQHVLVGADAASACQEFCFARYRDKSTTAESTRVQQPNRCDLLHKNGIHMFRSETAGYSTRRGWWHRQSYENGFRVRWFGGGGRRRVRVRNNSGQGAAMTIAITRVIRAAKLTGSDILRVGGSTWWSSLSAQG
jgi:hypothetical protein